MKKVFVFMLFFTQPFIVYSQEPNSYINDFFVIYKTKGTDVALDKIFHSNKWMIEHSKDKIESVKSQLKGVVNLIGGYYGYEFICERSIGNSLKLFSYLVKYDRQPLRFTFVFYKAKDIWMLYNFKYDDTLTEELEEAARAYRLKDNFDF